MERNLLPFVCLKHKNRFMEPKTCCEESKLRPRGASGAHSSGGRGVEVFKKCSCLISFLFFFLEGRGGGKRIAIIIGCLSVFMSGE